MKTTKRQFKEFQREFMGYVESLGLKDWDIRFVLEEDGNSDAWITVATAAQRVEVGLQSDIEDEPASLAKHEALELLLYPLRVRMMVYYSEAYVDQEIHKIIYKLMKVKLK